MNATIRFAVSSEADPLVHAFQAARLAVAHREAGRISGLKADMPVPTLLIVSGAEDPMAQFLAALEQAHAFAPVELDVDADTDEGTEDFAEYLRDRTDSVVIIARSAQVGPAS